MLHHSSKPGERRRGVILLVVLAMITLLAILGIAFVMTADATATSARIFREGQTTSYFSNLGASTSSDASLAWESFLGQLIYDVNDDAVGVTSAFRGHSLARTMYGWNPASMLNDRPWTGTGRLAEATPMGTGDGLVNYTVYSTAPNFVRDPGRLGVRGSIAAPQGPITGDLNVAYTYPDRNNMFLAWQDPLTGQVVVPSYHRNEVGGPLLAGNPNWASVDGKYRLMRPRPQDMSPAFPYPTDPYGDVKQLTWAPGGNDSIWMDFGGPVKTYEGKKYKCLVAPLVLGMDGRINLQMAGNILGPAKLHVSNQGWGPWEINLRQVLTANPTEWQQLFLGSGSISGKYGATGLPRGNAVTGGTWVGHRYPTDFNGIVDPPAATAPSGLFRFPGMAGLVPYQLFPDYPLNAYGNAVPVETTTTGTMAGTPNHPSIYNVFRPFQDMGTPVNSNRNFPASELAAILRMQDPGGGSLPSDILKLLALNLNDGSTTSNGANSAYRRNLVTTLSMALDRPGSPPYVYDRNAAGQVYGFQNPATPNLHFAAAAAQSFPGTASRGTTPPNSEFDAMTWKAALPAFRIDLKRTLVNFPTPDLTNWRFNAGQMTAVQAATLDRQQLARDIYQRLVLVTGAKTPTDAFAAGLTSPEFRAHRWLAQHAANLVDFIDNDDYSTAFQFYPGQWVFGVETPRLVINEAYAQWDNIRANLDAGLTKQNGGNYQVNVWAELHNPTAADSTQPEGGTARLHNGTWPMYRLRLAQAPSASLRLPENARGEYNFAGTADAPIVSTVVIDWGATDATRTVLPGQGRFNGPANGNNGYYVVGPAPDYTGPPTLGATNPNLASLATFSSTQMTYAKPVASSPLVAAGQPALYLEKLANPYLPENTNVNDPMYNPYITVDYMERLQVEDGRVFSDTAAITPPKKVTDRQSIGKWMPLAGAVGAAGAPGFLLPQDPTFTAPAMPPTNQPKHTMLRLNCREDQSPPSASTANQTLQVPFDTYVHLDRIPTSIGELMHLSAVRPHEVTQQFMTGTATSPLRFQHRARFSEQPTRLHRLLDHLTISSWAAGVAPNGRVPGKVNINAIWDPTVFNALVDAAAPNQFTQAEVNAVYAELISSRSPDQIGGRPVPGASSRPFLSVATGQAAGGDQMSAMARGMNNTILRPAAGGGALPAPVSDSTQQRMLEAATAFSGAYPAGQPLRRFELMSKLAGHLTTQSNVFAVWATVGFFEVVDDTVSPPRLGAEMDWPNLGKVRHRMFALIDRTQLQSFPTFTDQGQPNCTSGTNITASLNANRAPAVIPFTLMNAAGQAVGGANSVMNVNTGRPWQPQVGSLLTFDPDTNNEETVEAVPSGGGLGAAFLKSHGAGAVVINRGNPGPWRQYDPRRDQAVVPYSIVFE